MKSPAVVNYSSAPHSVELREFARPEPGADDVILAVEAVGVCGSDLHQWTSVAQLEGQLPGGARARIWRRIAATGQRA
jgi:L-iditol 2-dehydrogenase